MDIKDAKVGMLVQLNPNYTRHMFPVLQYMKETGEPLMVSSITPKYIRVMYFGGWYGFYPDAFIPYQDPEADMVVWDALEVGEHFISLLGEEAVKVNSNQYVLLGGNKLLYLRTPPLYKYKLA